MSYDYNALISQITSSRRQVAGTSNEEEKLHHLQQAVETFSTLSTHCPMTPLLWMQYSKDMADLLLYLAGIEVDQESSVAAASSVRETRLQLLELALSEFPGSAILRLHYLEILCQDDSDYDRVHSALLLALQSVGKGSHRNEGVLIAAIFQLAIAFYARHNEMDKALATFIQRARTPMKDVNDSLTSQLNDFCVEHSSKITDEQRQETFRMLEEARRYESRTFNALISCEDEVDVATHKDRILSRHQVDLGQLDWDIILRSDDKTCWMGYGGTLSTNAFIQYAQTCFRFQVRFRGKKYDLSKEEQLQIKEDEESVQRLALCVYERGIADCPTVETLWLSYCRHLEFLAQSDTSLLSRLKNVIDRSVRNCPYSLALYQQKLRLHGLFADQGIGVFDPDELQKIVQEAIDTKFLTSKEACLELYMSATQALRRQILSLLAKAPVVGSAVPTTLAYDEPESFNPSNVELKSYDIDDSTTQEMEDLCDDCRDFYETIDAYLRKNHSSWSEGRGRLWSEKAFVETNLLGPLSAVLGDDTGLDGDTSSKVFVEVVKSYDKLIKVSQPTPPDSYADYIHAFQACFPITKPASLMAKLRQTRFLYQKALTSLGRPKQVTEPLDHLLQRDFDSGLRNLCHNYLVFERYFGSEKSLMAASAAIQKKILKFAPSNQPPDATIPSSPLIEENTTALQLDEQPLEMNLTEGTSNITEENSTTPTKKHHLEDDENHTEPPTKKAKTEAEPTQTTAPTATQKVKVGDLEYPVHPFTVRVFGLTDEAEDMDLVDTFRPKCGAVVHAKIMREKHHHHDKGRSKGWGLVQFELQESVEKALALSEVIGICEKLIKVDRSHMPAVGLVPPGMHRVKPKGEGKSSKKNQKHREAKEGNAHNAAPVPEETSISNQDGGTKAPKKSSNVGILAFKPRGVRKVKVSLTSGSQQTKKEC